MTEQRKGGLYKLHIFLVPKNLESAEKSSAEKKYQRGANKWNHDNHVKSIKEVVEILSKLNTLGF